MSFAKYIAAAALVLPLTACKKTSVETKKVEINIPSTEDLKRQTDESIRNAQDSTNDIVAEGGQPGHVYLSGAVVTHDPVGRTVADEKIRLVMDAGLGWRGTRAPLYSSSELNSKLTKEDLQALSTVGQGNVKYNFGCPYDGTSQVYESATPGANEIVADSVEICDSARLPEGLIVIKARHVLLDRATFERKGGPGEMMVVIAEELILRGRNSIVTKGEDGPTTVLSGPQLSISAVRLTGDGTLEIQALGANYVKAEKP